MLGDLVVGIPQNFWGQGFVQVAQVSQLKQLLPPLCVCPQQLLEARLIRPDHLALILQGLHLSLYDAVAYLANGRKVLVVLLKHYQNHSLLALRKSGRPVLPPVQAEPLSFDHGNHAVRVAACRIVEAKRVMPLLTIRPLFYVIFRPFYFE